MFVPGGYRRGAAVLPPDAPLLLLDRNPDLRTGAVGLKRVVKKSPTVSITPHTISEKMESRIHPRLSTTLPSDLTYGMVSSSLFVIIMNTTTIRQKSPPPFQNITPCTLFTPTPTIFRSPG